jgi:PilZ domain-containing protein
MGEMPERRCFPRHPCTGGVEILQNGSHFGWGKVSDLSRCGCYLETTYPLPVGTELQLRLTIAGTLLDIGARVVWITPQVGMGMCFVVISQEEDRKLAQIIEEVTAIGHSPAVQQAEQLQPGGATLRITREAESDILAKIIKRVYEKGSLTKQELIDIVKANQ